MSELLYNHNSKLNKMEHLRTDSEFRKQVEEHRTEDAEYYVHIDTENGLVIPPYCTCCMEKTGYKEVVKLDTKNDCSVFKDTFKDHVPTVPLCPKCKKHREAYLWNVILIRWTIMLVSFIISKICLGKFPENTWISFFAGLAVFELLYNSVISIVRPHRLEKNSSTHVESLKMKYAYKNGYPELDHKDLIITRPLLEIQFSNWEYAQLFREANRENIKKYGEIYRKRTTNKHSLRELEYYTDTNIIAMIVYIIVWLLSV